MMNIQEFYDAPTFTLSYVVWDPASLDAIVIDPVLNYEPASSQTSTESVEAVSTFIQDKDLKPQMILETHAHADHLSGAAFLARNYSVPIAIGEKIAQVQGTFKKLLDLPDSFATDGSQFGKLLRDHETFWAGTLKIQAIATPGHTPACMSFLIEDAVFTGDALFMHDYGTGRADFPGGSAEALYDSIHERLYGLPDSTRVFVGHDYQPQGRPLAFETTIGRSKAENPQLRADTSREEFVERRNARDASLASPRLLFQSIQVNVDAGRLPESNRSGRRYLRVPINLFFPTDDDGKVI